MELVWGQVCVLVWYAFLIRQKVRKSSVCLSCGGLVSLSAYCDLQKMVKQHHLSLSHTHMHTVTPCNSLFISYGSLTHISLPPSHRGTEYVGHSIRCEAVSPLLSQDPVASIHRWEACPLRTVSGLLWTERSGIVHRAKQRARWGVWRKNTQNEERKKDLQTVSELCRLMWEADGHFLLISVDAQAERAFMCRADGWPQLCHIHAETSRSSQSAERQNETRTSGRRKKSHIPQSIFFKIRNVTTCFCFLQVMMQIQNDTKANLFQPYLISFPVFFSFMVLVSILFITSSFSVSNFKKTETICHFQPFNLWMC